MSGGQTSGEAQTPSGWEHWTGRLARRHGALRGENGEEAAQDCWGLAAKALSGTVATITPSGQNSRDEVRRVHNWKEISYCPRSSSFPTCGQTSVAEGAALLKVIELVMQLLKIQL